MATVNPFDLLGDDDYEDPSQFLAAQQLKAPATPAAPATAAGKKAASQALPAKNQAQANLPSKPLPPYQAVRDARKEGYRGGGRGGGRGDERGRGRGRGRRFEQDSGEGENGNFVPTNNGYSGGYRVSQDGDGDKSSERRGGYGGSRVGFRGGRRGDFSNGDDSAEGGRPPRRVFERRSGTGRGNEFKRDGAGRGNWGTPADEIVPGNEEPVNEGEKIVDTEKQSGEEVVSDDKKDSTVAESDEKKEPEPEDKEMTLEEYQKVLEENRKALLALKSEERKVDLDKEFESMQLLPNKKNDDDVFVKLGSDKDKRKEVGDKAKKSVSINEFLKPAEGENYYRPGGRGRGRGERGRGGYRSSTGAPSIEDVGQFPILGS